MQNGKTQIIWVSADGSGKIRNILINPFILIILAIVLVFCVCTMPFLQKGVISLSKRVTELEEKRERLRAEILTLRYVKRALRRIEAKEKRLRGYFGMEQYNALAQVTGGGGASSLHLSTAPSAPNQGEARRGGKTGEADPGPLRAVLPENLQRLGSNYEILQQLVMNQGELWRRTPSIFPVSIKNPRITSGFGWRMNPFTSKREFHAGIDIIGPKGTKVVAPGGGVVLRAGYDRWIGNYVVLMHTENMKTIYGHLKRSNNREGMEIQRGDLIGIMGNTGLSTSRHLHYGVILDNRAIDPMQFILDRTG